VIEGLTPRISGRDRRSAARLQPEVGVAERLRWSGSEKDSRLTDKLGDPGGSRSLGPCKARHEFLQRVDKVQTPLTSLPFLSSCLLDLSSELLEFTLDAYLCVAHGSDSVEGT
jgi:hypothetical protein